MRMHLSDKQKLVLNDWIKNQTSIHTEFRALELPTDIYLELKDLHHIELFDEEIEEYVRKQVLKEFM
jgi:hypothetical protein